MKVFLIGLCFFVSTSHAVAGISVSMNSIENKSIWFETKQNILEVYNNDEMFKDCYDNLTADDKHKALDSLGAEIAQINFSTSLVEETFANFLSSKSHKRFYQNQLTVYYDYDLDQDGAISYSERRNVAPIVISCNYYPPENTTAF